MSRNPRQWLLLTQRPYTLYSAIVSVCTARHQGAAVALLQQVSITQSVGTDTMACLFKINMLGEPGAACFCVVALANGMTISGGLRLDPDHAWFPEYNV